MKKIKTLAMLLFFVLSSQNAFSQEEFEEDAQDVPAAPINDAVILLALSGILIGYKAIKMQEEK